ncbi:MAG: hypothetical protein U9Q92_07845 [archaeon]|nr:hypothetical protein [archaeon]
MKTKVLILCFAILACIVLLLNNASSVVYDVCEAMSGEEISYDDFQVLIESIYNDECNEAINVKTTFSMSKDDFSELAYTYNIIDSKGNPLVFYRTGTPSPLGAGAILVYGNDGDFPVKLGDRLHIWTSGTPKDIMIELSIEGCDPYDDECDAICSYEDDYVCDPLCYVDNQRDNIQCDIDCVDQNNNHVVDEGDLDGICDPDCYNDDLDPKRAYDPDCIDFSNDKTNSDGICDPDSQGIRDGLCDPDCAPANHLCDFDCNGTTHPGNPHGYNDTDCYFCDGICNGFCSYDCAYLDHDPDCPEGFTDWFELTECCGNNNCGMSENCQSCPRDCPEDNISVDPPVERNCSIFNKGPGDNFFCCPDANNSAMYGCADLTLNKQENESCTCQPECADGLVCNGPKGDMHCCPEGYKWDGTECKETLCSSSVSSCYDHWHWEHYGTDIFINLPANTCDFYEVCHPVVKPIAQEIVSCCNNKCEGNCHSMCNRALTESGLAATDTKATRKKCYGMYALFGMGPAAQWTRGYDNSHLEEPASIMFSERVWMCTGYSIMLTTLLRSVGYEENEAYSVCGPGHMFNMVKFPGDSYRIADTVGNKLCLQGMYHCTWYAYCNHGSDCGGCSNDEGAFPCPSAIC